MSIKKDTSYGAIKISDQAIAVLAGGAVNESYGVVGMTSQKVLKDGFYELLKKENYSKGVVVENTDDGLIIDLYVIVSYGVNISEVVKEIQKKVKYTLEKALNMKVLAVNVFVQGVKVIE
ncbi:MAG: Asp23/Gls24 family envelope stress response protein [Erysipelotrichaceae bacterium]|nr:Asp23/Gls24 family envelope stress response protein [Erysipelotrichaceae bacterium]